MYIAPSSSEDMPIAVIRGARRGAWRSGLYATRSIAMLTSAQKSIVITNRPRSGRMMPAPDELGVSPSNGIMASEKKAPSVNTSPCAKLISSMMP